MNALIRELALFGGSNAISTAVNAAASTGTVTGIAVGTAGYILGKAATKLTSHMESISSSLEGNRSLKKTLLSTIAIASASFSLYTFFTLSIGFLLQNYQLFAIMAAGVTLGAAAATYAIIGTSILALSILVTVKVCSSFNPKATGTLSKVAHVASGVFVAIGTYLKPEILYNMATLPIRLGPLGGSIAFAVTTLAVAILIFAYIARSE